MGPGDRVGTYFILGTLGRGSFGRVYLCHPEGTPDRRVAVKILDLPGATAGEDDARGQFEREARFLASLQHPGVVHIHSMETLASPPYIVMEYLEGGSLADRLRRGPVPVAEALAFVRSLASTLHDLHSSRGGICHRDIKPANILLRRDGSPVISDFGISRRLDTSAFTSQWGTFGYAPPERARHALDARVPAPDPRQWDVYSLGVVLYEMVTGRRAFLEDGGDADRVLQEQHRRPCLDPQLYLDPADPLSEGTCALVRDMTAGRPDRRLRAAKEVVGRIDRVVAPPEVPRPAGRLLAAGILAAAAAATGAAALIGLAAWGVLRASGPGEHSPPASAETTKAIASPAAPAEAGATGPAPTGDGAGPGPTPSAPEESRATARPPPERTEVAAGGAARPGNAPGPDPSPGIDSARTSSVAPSGAVGQAGSPRPVQEAGGGPPSADAASNPTAAARGGADADADAPSEAASPPSGQVNVFGPPGATLAVNGEEVGHLPMSVPLSAGIHTFVVTEPNGQACSMRRIVSFNPPDRPFTVSLTCP